MKKCLLIISGLTVAITGAWLSLTLLIINKLSGTEFVSFTLGTILIGIVISLLSEISEFSIGGNIVKLKEAKKDADKSIEAIKDTYKSVMKGQLLLVQRMKGGFSSTFDTKDGRVDDFWAIYAVISDAKLNKELVDEIYQTASEIAKGQLSIVKNFIGDSNNDALETSHGKLPTKSEITKYISENKDKIINMKSLLESVDEYEKLLPLFIDTKA